MAAQGVQGIQERNALRPQGAVSPTNEQIVTALKAEAEPPVAPDMSKPIRLRYWKLPHTLGTLTQTQIEVDGFVNDGTAQGKVRSIWFYPAGGFAIAELEVGFRPNQLEQDVRIERIVLLNGHGRESSK